MAGRLLTLCLCMLELVLASPSVQDVQQPFGNDYERKLAPPLPWPGNDRWYAPPDNLASRKPGDIIKWRYVPGPISLDNKAPVVPKKAIQMQYRTQNAVGRPIASVVTVLIPFNPKRRAIFGYSFFSDAANPSCNPSIAVQAGLSQDGMWTKSQMAPIIAALGAGFIVTIADDGGPQAAFPSGLTSAYTTLDSLRAARASHSITGIEPDSLITLNGYSGGAIAAAFTSELEASYAPELNIRGYAIGGLIPDLPYLLRNWYNATGEKTLTWPILVGLSHDYPDLARWLDENLEPSMAADFFKTETMCIDGNGGHYKDKDIGKYFKRGHASLQDKPVQDALIDGGVMGLRAVPKAPWYIYESISDEASPPQLVKNLFNKYCKAGTRIIYEENQIRIPHHVEAAAGFPGAFSWTKERIAGIPAPLGCRMTPVSLNSAIFGPYTAISGMWDIVLAQLGVPILRGKPWKG